MRSSILKAVCVCGVAALAVSTNAAGFSETKSFSSNSLTVTNLIGEVRVAGHDGSDFTVVIDVQGEDASRGSVELETKGNSLAVVFPKSKRYVYPGLDADKTVSFRPSGHDESWLGALLGSSTIKVDRRGNGMEVWADVEIRVPEGGRLELRHGAGAVTAKNVEGDLDLDSHYGKVAVDSIDGDLRVDTGSGNVSVAQVRGDVRIDTGSGDVTLAEMAAAGDVSIDTGSGDVSLTDVSGADFDIDTGSGNIDGNGLRAEGARIDTGSGSVALFLAEMGRNDFDIDTGSGGITLAIPSGAGCRVEADSGSGGVRVDIEGVNDLRREDDGEVEFTVGGGGARVSLDSGSGAIRIIESD